MVVCFFIFTYVFKKPNIWHIPTCRYTNDIGSLSPLIIEYNRLQLRITGKVFTQYTLVIISMFFLKNVSIQFEYIIIIFVNNNRDDYSNIKYALGIIVNSCTTYKAQEGIISISSTKGLRCGMWWVLTGSQI